MKSNLFLLYVSLLLSLSIAGRADDATNGKADDALVAAAAVPSGLMKASQIPDTCSSAKEFITTFEYLRGHKELGLSSQEMFNVATAVSKGCTGAAARFVKVFEVLTKSDAGTRDAMKIAIQLASKPQAYCDTFVKVFSRSYLSEYLDLDYFTSLKLANALATDYKGDPNIAAKDFVKLVDFCVNDKEVGLAKPECGLIAGRIVKHAENFHALVAGEYIKVYHFLTSESGPSAPIITALKISENVVSQGPEAGDNFITAYNYAIDRSGLNFTAGQSITFAENIAKNTYINLKPNEFKKSIEDRLPASN